MKKILIATILAVGLAAGGWAYAHGSGNSYGMTGNDSYAMMGGGGSGGYGMMGGGGSGGYGMMGGGGSGGYGNMGGGNGMGNGSGYGNYNGQNNYSNGDRSIQTTRNYQQNKRFLDETVHLRKELNDKRFEYQEAQRNPNASRQRLSRLESQLHDLQSQLNEKAEQYR